MKHAFLCALCVFTLNTFAAEPLTLTADFAKLTGEIRPLHGGNCGPLNYGELTDLSTYHRELNLPLTRLHDCHWPNPDVVDIHAVFPNPDADPAKPESYDFRRTDDYIKAIVAAGSPILYRLGESIEHSKRKYFVHPPADLNKWAAICAGIIAHYNDGWAGGMKLNIKYWEIWNEPENRPTCWTGTDEQFLQLYETAAKHIKSRWPDLKVGGPSFGYSGKLTNGKFEPGEFMLKFLKHCKDQNAPLDFFSWHLYTNNPAECMGRGRGVRETLDKFGFTKTESHLNEWNYLPGNDWKPMTIKNDYSAREKFYDRIGSAEGAAFAVCALINMQDAPIDMANYYMCDNQGFGITTFHGVPRRNFYALKAFRQLLETPLRAACTGGNEKSICICAGLNREKSEARILIANMSDRRAQLKITNLPWPETKFELLSVDAARNITPINSGDLTPESNPLNGLATPYVALLIITKR